MPPRLCRIFALVTVVLACTFFHGGEGARLDGSVVPPTEDRTMLPAPFRYLCSFFGDGTTGEITLSCNLVFPSSSHPQYNISLKTQYRFLSQSEGAFFDESAGILYVTALNYSSTPCCSQVSLLVIDLSTDTFVRGYPLPLNNFTKSSLFLDSSTGGKRLLFHSYNGANEYLVSFNPSTGAITTLFPFPNGYTYQGPSFSFNTASREVSGVFKINSGNGPSLAYLSMNVDTGISHSVTLSDPAPLVLYFDSSSATFYSIISSPTDTSHVQLMNFDPTLGKSSPLSGGSPIIALPSPLSTASAIDTLGGVAYVYSSTGATPSDILEVTTLELSSGKMAASPFRVLSQHGTFLLYL